MKKLRLLLVDQLNSNHSWYQEVNLNTIYCFFEMRQEIDYVKHHIQKIAGFFASMRNLANELEDQNHRVLNYQLNDGKNTQSLTDNLSNITKEYTFEKFEYQLPDEYRLDKQLTDFCEQIDIATETFSTEHFYTEREDLKTFFKGKKTFLIETFYRNMRKTHQVLMVDQQLEGDKWNFDASNRKKWKGYTLIPPAKNFDNDVSQIIADLERAGVQSLGKINQKYFEHPISGAQYLEQLDYFCEHLLIHFGDFQDAMHADNWYLFHSKLSFALNTKMMSPKEIINAKLQTYRERSDEIDAWCIGIYLDALKWVQLPNTGGMSQFADGGKIATKPYVLSGSYMHKMSNYCDGCHYNKKKKFEDDTCPFNSLYYTFLDEKQKNCLLTS